MEKILEIVSLHYDPINKVSFINVLRDYIQCDIVEAQNILKQLTEGQIVRLQLDLPIEECDAFLYKISELGIGIRYYSWHEEEPDGGLKSG